MSDTAPQPPPFTARRILIVDDEEIILVALRETLRLEGYDVVTASDAIQALQILNNESFAVIISDQQMPILKGLEFLTRVKQIQPNATRIIITAVLNLNTVIDAINKGEIYRFIVKPWLREELLATVRNAVQRFELITRNQQLQEQTQAANQQLTALNQSLLEQNQRLTCLNQNLNRNLSQFLELTLNAVELFYPVLANQARRASQLAAAFAGTLNLKPEQRQSLHIAALLHDVGLLAIPRPLIKRWLAHPESLTAAERELIERHPLVGQELARFVEHLSEVGLLIRAHHERFDGSGYPDRRAGADIPWLARLLAVAVAFCESNLPPNDALETIKTKSGAAFDPDAVLVLIKSFPQAVLQREEREVSLADLQPGMILAKGIYTAAGLLLVPEGQELNPVYIEQLRNHGLANLMNESLLVYC